MQLQNIFSNHKGGYTMSDFPKCKAQKYFESIIKELIKVLSTMEEEQIIDIFEYAQCQALNSKRENKNG